MKFVCSWSGGKDSALALARAVAAHGRDAILLTMFTEDDERSRSHGLPKAVLAAQAAQMRFPSITGSASWTDYTPVFVETLRRLKIDQGIEAAVFGDIDLEPHREWCLRVCDTVGIDCLHPLWGEPRDVLVRDCLASGVRASVIAVRDGTLPPSLLGRELDESMLSELGGYGVDLAGEQGEYHTVVVDGPLFATPLKLRHRERVLRDGYWFLDVSLDDETDRFPA
jgi:diphthine-ammonia ligase